MVVSAVFISATLVSAAPSDTDSNDVFWSWGDAAGSSKIVRNDGGISGNIKTSLSNEVDSTNGIAVTLWIVVFNNPGACATDPCTDADLFESAVMPDVLYGAGNVVGNSEKFSAGYHRKAGDNSGSIADLFGMPTKDNGEPFGLINPRGAEIHYVVRTHGPKNPAEMPAQIQSYGGGCVFGAPYGYPVPTGPNDLYLGDGDCQDVQFAINQP
jgi:hypothetical protein